MLATLSLKESFLVLHKCKQFYSITTDQAIVVPPYWSYHYKTHTNVNSSVIHNLTKQKLSKHCQRPPHHTEITDKFFWKMHNRIQIEEIS